MLWEHSKVYHSELENYLLNSRRRLLFSREKFPLECSTLIIKFEGKICEQPHFHNKVNESRKRSLHFTSAMKPNILFRTFHDIVSKSNNTISRFMLINENYFML